jgi:type I restriction enzyme S subunit
MILAHSFPVAINAVDIAINQDMKAIKPVKGLNVVYLLNCLTSLKRQILKLISTAGHGTRKFDSTAMQKLFIPKPPEDLQNQFAAIVEKVEGLKSRYQQSLSDLESLYGALSQKAFRGELDLSRVALPAELPDKFEKELSQPETAADDNSDMMHRFSTLDTPGMSVKDARRSLLQQWFDEWVGDTAVDEELSPERFWQRARFSALDHRDEDDETEDFTAEDYDIFKEKLFSAIEGGLISQTRNTVEVGGEAEFGNRIILKKAG